MRFQAGKDRRRVAGDAEAQAIVGCGSEVVGHDGGMHPVMDQPKIIILERGHGQDTQIITRGAFAAGIRSGLHKRVAWIALHPKNPL